MAENADLIRLLALVVAVVLLVPVVMMLVAWPMMGMWGGGHMWNGVMWDGSGGTWMWALLWGLPVLVLLGGGYLLYRAVSRSGRTATDPALEELRLAYARGDLSEEEFEERRRRLRREE